MKKNILIATGNPHKMRMITSIVSPFFSEITYLDQLSSLPEPKEIGNNFQEIAEKKAIHYSHYFSDYVIGTDGGMQIPYLENWNALFTKRFINKDDATDFERMDYLLQLMENKQDEERKMQWNEAIAIAQNGKILFSTQVIGAEGIMQQTYDKNKYRPGIWLCSLWYFPQFRKNFFDLTPEETEYAEISWQKLKESTQKFLKNYQEESGR